MDSSAFFRSTAKGRHVSRTTLFERADRVIAMMYTLELRSREANQKDHGQ